MVLTANIQYALEGYGIGENSLHTEVLAQASSGGSGSGSGGGTSGGGTGGSTSCDLCVIKVDGEVKFSCEYMINESCSGSKNVPFVGTVSVSCMNAKQCINV